MSDEPVAPAAIEAPQTPTGIAWGDPIDETRKQELWARLRAWWDEADHGERKGPFAGERLTGAEVFWLAVCALAEEAANTAGEAEQSLRVARDDYISRWSISLTQLHLAGANLGGAQLEGADLTRATLIHADLRQASLDKKTGVIGTQLEDVRLDGVIFDNTNLSVIDWTRVPVLQDERIARQAKYGEEGEFPHTSGERKTWRERRVEYQQAARAYRRLLVALQANGMSEESAVYAYRAQLMQRAVYRYSGWGGLGQWLFSWFLWLIAGYGYRPGRSVAIYLASVALFAVGYYALGVTLGPHLSPYEAAVVSLTAFHGRGFFAIAFQPGDPQAGLAALEAVFGLLIEISFVATFTQRFFVAK